jgi:hypothetical protein
MKGVFVVRAAENKNRHKNPRLLASNLQSNYRAGRSHQPIGFCEEIVMQHPFEKIVGLDGSGPLAQVDSSAVADDVPCDTASSRRTFFAKSLGAAAGAAAVLASRLGSAVDTPPGQKPVTTAGLAEEGGDPRRATTFAIGEEGGWTQLPSGVITTVAPFEEGGLTAPSATFGTSANSASTFKFQWPRAENYRERPGLYQNRFTSRALGEEGGGR